VTKVHYGEKGPTKVIGTLKSLTEVIGKNLEGTAPKIAKTILQASANDEWCRDCLAELSKSDITRLDELPGSLVTP
jgi:hypothetical protein